MVTTTIPTKHREIKPAQHRVKRDVRAWEALRGIWQDKKIKDVVAWQKKIRKEWERTPPKLK